MKTAVLFLVLLTSMWAVLGVAWLRATSDSYLPQEHSRLQTMDQSAPASQSAFGLGSIFGTLVILTFLACMALGARHHGRLGKFGWGLLPAGIVFLGVYAMMLVSYRQYVEQVHASHADEQMWAATYSGPFPAPTMWMLFGLWAAPLVFVVLYTAAFHRAVYTAEDQRRFEALLADRASRSGADD